MSHASTLLLPFATHICIIHVYIYTYIMCVYTVYIIPFYIIPYITPNNQGCFFQSSNLVNHPNWYMVNPIAPCLNCCCAKTFTSPTRESDETVTTAARPLGRITPRLVERQNHMKTCRKKKKCTIFYENHFLSRNPETSDMIDVAEIAPVEVDVVNIKSQCLHSAFC